MCVTDREIRDYMFNELSLGQKIDDINIAGSILNDLSLSEYEKAYKLLKLFSTANRFDKNVKLLLEYGNDNPKLMECIDIIGLISEQLHYYEDNGYEIASSAVLAYIWSSYTDDVNFFENLGIREDAFNRYVGKTKRNYPELYSKYHDKVSYNRQMEYNKLVNNFIDIASAIESGFFMDGIEFSLLEFWRRVPFIKREPHKYDLYREINHKIPKCTFSFITRVINFTEHTLSKEQHNTIKKFLFDNNYSVVHDITELDLKVYFSEMKRYVKYEKGQDTPIIDVVFTNEDKQRMLDYVALSGLPMISEILKLVQLEYINGKITEETISTLKENKGYSKGGKK